MRAAPITRDAGAPREPLAALVSLAFAYFILGTGSLAVVGLVQPMAAALEVTPAEVANLVTAFALAFAVTAPLAQVVFGRHPRRTLLLTGLCIMSLAALAGALATAYWVLLVSRVAAGIGAAMVGPMASAIGAGLVPPERQGRALAIVFGGMTLAVVLAVPMAAWLGVLVGWRAVLVLLMALGIVAAAGVLWKVHDRSRGVTVNLRALFGVVVHRQAGFSVATTLLQMAAMFATYALIVPYLSERMAVGPGGMVVLLAYGVGGIAGNLLAGGLTDRLGADRTVLTSLAVLAATFVALWVLPASLALVLPLFVIWSTAGTLFQAPQQKRLVDIDPSRRSLLLATNASALYLGMSLGAFLAGVVHRSAGSAALPIASLTLMALAIASYLSSRARS
jgi:DHA1 family inner membrane transport protein